MRRCPANDERYETRNNKRHFCATFNPELASRHARSAGWTEGSRGARETATSGFPLSVIARHLMSLKVNSSSADVASFDVVADGAHLNLILDHPNGQQLADKRSPRLLTRGIRHTPFRNELSSNDDFGGREAPENFSSEISRRFNICRDTTCSSIDRDLAILGRLWFDRDEFRPFYPRLTLFGPISFSRLPPRFRSLSLSLTHTHTFKFCKRHKKS